MKNIPVHTMQIIPQGWQDTVELHIVAMTGHASGATYNAKGRPSPFEKDFTIACCDFVDYIEGIFGSLQGFDNFLKNDLLQKLSERGYVGSIPTKWNEEHFEKKSVEDTAWDIFEIYTQIYKKALWNIETLPQNTKHHTLKL